MGIDARECLTVASGIASGLATSAVDKAKEVSAGLMGQAGSLGGQAPEVVTQAAGLADDLLTTGKENGELLLSTIRAEAEKAVVRFGMGRSDDIRRLEARIASLEVEVSSLRAGSTSSSAAEPVEPASTHFDSTPGKKRKIYLEDPDG